MLGNMHPAKVSAAICRACGELFATLARRARIDAAAFARELRVDQRI